MKQCCYIASTICFLIISGCSVQPKNSITENIADGQAKKINQSLPVKAAGYTLVFAKHHGSEISLTLVEDNQPAMRLSPSAMLSEYLQRLCSDPAVRTYLAEGVSYRLQVNNLQGNRQQVVLLTEAQCMSRPHSSSANNPRE